MIQIIGGKNRSRKIETPDSSTTLPTKNMVRSAMFSALHDVKGDVVLDLYAGSGALGLEALSRGAREAVFVEVDAKAAKVVAKNIATLKEQKRRFSLVFLDPPYAMKSSYQEVVDYLLSSDMLEENARLILEYEGEIPFDSSSFGFAKEYKYGKSKFLYLKEKNR